MNRIKFTLLLLLHACLTATAQPDYHLTKWTKTVSREIDVADIKELTQFLTNEIKAGNIQAYDNIDITLTTRMRKEDFDDLMGWSTHYEVTSVKNGSVKQKAIPAKKFDYSSLIKYRILEQWTFEPVTCNTEIRILGIAPVRRVYGPDGNARGKQAIFWLRYGSARPLLDKYEKMHPAAAITNNIWRDNFSAVSTPFFKNGEWHCVAKRTLDLNPLPDTITNHLRLESHDTSLSYRLWYEKAYGRIATWARFEHQLKDSLQRTEVNFKGKTDTQIIIDPITNTEIVKYVDPINVYENSTGEKFHVIEKWAFKPNSGLTTIYPIAIAPLINLPDAILIPEYWVNYTDISEIIRYNDARGIRHNFSGELWEDYFRSAEKPLIIE